MDLINEENDSIVEEAIPKLNIPFLKLIELENTKNQFQNEWNRIKLENICTFPTLCKIFCDFIQLLDKKKKEQNNNTEIFPVYSILLLFLRLCLFKTTKQFDIKIINDIIKQYLALDTNPRFEDVSEEIIHSIQDKVKKEKISQSLFDSVYIHASDYLLNNILPLFLKSDEFYNYRKKNGKPRYKKCSRNDYINAIVGIQGDNDIINVNTVKRSNTTKIKRESSFGLMRAQSNSDEISRRKRSERFGLLFSAHRISTSTLPKINITVHKEEQNEKKDDDNKEDKKEDNKDIKETNNIIKNNDSHNEVLLQNDLDLKNIQLPQDSNVMSTARIENTSKKVVKRACFSSLDPPSPDETNLQKDNKDETSQNNKIGENTNCVISEEIKASEDKISEIKEELIQNDEIDDIEIEAQKLNALKAKLKKLEADIQVKKKRRLTVGIEQ